MAASTKNLNNVKTLGDKYLELLKGKIDCINKLKLIDKEIDDVKKELSTYNESQYAKLINLMKKNDDLKTISLRDENFIKKAEAILKEYKENLKGMSDQMNNLGRK